MIFGFLFIDPIALILFNLPCALLALTSEYDHNQTFIYFTHLA